MHTITFTVTRGRQPWYVAGRYIVRSGIVEPASADGGRFYAPEPIIDRVVEDFAAARNKGEFKKFVGRYGLLGYAHLHTGAGGDPVKWAVNHARKVRAILELLSIVSDVRTAARRLNSAALRREMELPLKRLGFPIQDERAAEKARTIGRQITFLDEKWAAVPRSGMDTDRSYTRAFLRWPSDPVGAVYEAIATSINPHAKGVHYELTLAQNGEPGPRLIWHALVELMYFHLLKQVNGDFRHCEAVTCGRMFFVHDPRQRFHDTTCQNRENQRRYRASLQAKIEGQASKRRIGKGKRK